MHVGGGGGGGISYIQWVMQPLLSPLLRCDLTYEPVTKGSVPSGTFGLLYL